MMTLSMLLLVRKLLVLMSVCTRISTQMTDNGEKILSRDIYRLGHRFDFFRMLSCYFTTVGFYVSSMMIVIILYMFLYGRIYLSLSSLEATIVRQAEMRGSRALESAMASQSVVQLGLLMALLPIAELSPVPVLVW